MFLVSSFEPRPTNSFYGLCFDGADLIIGAEGAARFHSSRHGTIAPGLDGSYIALSTSGEETTVGTDYAGYQKLFYFSDGPVWAVSNSFLAIVEHLRDRHVPIKVEEHHLAAWFLTLSFGNQLTCFKTCVRGLRLLPAGKVIVISDGRLSTRALPRTAAPETYEDSLARFIRTWTSRLRTVLASDLGIVSEITGGRDSRIVLGLLRRAARRDLSRVGFACGPRGEDLPVAGELAKRFGFALNQLPPTRSIATADAYRNWKLHNLGVYGPVYFPGSRYRQAFLRLNGAGGEAHRSFYPERPIEEYLDSRLRKLPSPDLAAKLKSDILADVAMLQADEDLDPLILHYRHFRDRIHGGRASLSVMASSPLASRILRECSARQPREFIRSDRMILDLLYNVDPELAEQPYDTPKKALTDDVKRSLIRLPESDLDTDAVGEVFWAGPPELASGRFDPAAAIAIFVDEYRAALLNVGSTSLFPSEYLQQASDKLEAALTAGRFGHAIDAQSATHVILAAAVSSSARLAHCPAPT